MTSILWIAVIVLCIMLFNHIVFKKEEQEMKFLERINVFKRIRTLSDDLFAAQRALRNDVREEASIRERDDVIITNALSATTAAVRRSCKDKWTKDDFDQMDDINVWFGSEQVLSVKRNKLDVNSIYIRSVMEFENGLRFKVESMENGVGVVNIRTRKL